MDKLVFFSGSADVAPGKGAGEVVACPEHYRVLSGMKDWRKRLSNFDTEVDFVFEGKIYRSIEHAFQAKKISLKDPEKAALFALDSGSALSRGTGADAQKQRKMVLLGPAELAQWDAMSESVMAQIALEKYEQHPDSVASRVLKATGSAELWHLMRQRGKPSRLVRFKHLEDIRARLM